MDNEKKEILWMNSKTQNILYIVIGILSVMGFYGFLHGDYVALIATLFQVEILFMVYQRDHRVIYQLKVFSIAILLAGIVKLVLVYFNGSSVQSNSAQIIEIIYPITIVLVGSFLFIMTLQKLRVKNSKVSE